MSPFDPFGRQIFAGNDFATAAGDGAIPVINPATFGREGLIADTDGAEVARVLERANAAQKDWAALDAKTRAGLLHQVADSIEEADPRPVCELMTREMGKPYPEAVGELANVAPVYRYYAELARDDAGRVAGPIQPSTFQFSCYDPYGVSVHIVPYNFPLLLFSWGAAASLAAGNAVILKPSEYTTLCSLKFMEHFRALPPDIVSCLPGGGRVGAALVQSEATHVVAFTGSVVTGQKIYRACAEHMKPCVIEAGGNDPMIVTDSAPIDVAAAGAVTAAFHLSGQVCTAAERFYVFEAVHDAFVEEFVRETQRLRVGDGLGKHEIGPLVSEAQRDKVARLVEEAVAAGARLECGGRVPPEHNTGWFYEPTILTGVSPDMAIMNTEVFGPVAPVCRVRDLDEAIALANRSRYGLGASIFTTRTEEAMRAIRELETGLVWVNNPLVDNDALPFGGRKSSGVGRLLGRHGLDAFRQAKFVTFDPVPIKHDWWYPYPDEAFYPGDG